MASSNPFRKLTTPIITDFDASSIPRASRPPPSVSFGSSDTRIDPEIPATTKAKVVKRVRVLSPPPLSPDSPEWPNNRLPTYEHHESNHNEVFAATEMAMPAGGMPGVAFGTPQGPALVEEMRNEGEALKAGNKAMDVDAFKRLLLTGDKPESRINAPEATAQPTTAPIDLHLGQDDEDSNLSDSSLEAEFGSKKKLPPPPPSSRHGKAIKNIIGASDTKAASPSEPLLTADPRTDSVAVDEVLNEGQAKKATPAPPPPPPRGHARSDSRAPSSGSIEQRSSLDAPRPGSRHGNAPVPPPPPPRKGNANHRVSSSHTSPTSATFPDAEAQDESDVVTEGHNGPSRHALPPPPPPARHSVRRLQGAESKHKDSAVPPPPPPTRKRGTSKGNADQPTTSYVGQSDALLADLSALQREVDAAMGKLG